MALLGHYPTDKLISLKITKLKARSTFTLNGPFI